MLHLHDVERNATYGNFTTNNAWYPSSH